MQSGGFIGRLLGPLMKVVLPPINSALTPLVERVFVLLG